MKIVGPRLTVDIIITINDPLRVVLIQRKNPPYGWAIPGGFVDYGETVEHAAVREGKEETGLDVELLRQFHVYSDPSRDERFHSVSIVFVGSAVGTPLAGDDAAEAKVFTKETLPGKIVFDHRQILEDYFFGRY
ncbi:MAG: NUDIX hydrolase [Acidobacteria bacterium]|nr:NUDIX hydrolase [Acidobacteriota bacterium]MBI3655223.1 NUDIX hydrolase [Acidobacteriota bacterium]